MAIPVTSTRIPSAYIPLLKEFADKLCSATGRKITVQDVIWMGIAKFIGADDLLGDLMRQRAELYNRKEEQRRKREEEKNKIFEDAENHLDHLDDKASLIINIPHKRGKPPKEKKRGPKRKVGRPRKEPEPTDYAKLFLRKKKRVGTERKETME